MEIESASESVEVEDFAREVKVGHGFAFEGFEVELVERDPAAGHEFVFIEAFSFDQKAGVEECLGEVLGLGAGEVGPGEGIGEADGLGEAVPESFGEVGEGTVGGELSSTVVLAETGEGLGDIVGGGVAEPVDFDGKVVVGLGDVASFPGRSLEDGGSAEAPMGDEKWALGGEVEGFD